MPDIKPKILYILSRIPYPLEKGDKLRAYYQMRELSNRYTIIIFAVYQGKVNPESHKMLSAFCSDIYFVRVPLLTRLWQLFLFSFTKKPMQAGYFFSRKAKRELRQLVASRKPDVAVCQMVRMAEYMEGLNIPCHFDYMDALSMSLGRRIQYLSFPKKTLIRLEHKRLQWYELQLLGRFRTYSIISDQDREAFPEENREGICIIPNGIDESYFTYPAQPKDIDLIFTGNMAYPPNILAAVLLVREIMPLVWQKRPETHLVIVGTSPVAKVKALAGDKVRVTGWVDNIRDYYARSRVFVAPMQIGAGQQNKLLEAMAMGVPCVTSVLANNAMGATDGIEVLLGDSPRVFSEKILQLLRSEPLCKEVGESGRRFVKTNYTWESSVGLLEKNLFPA
ncbi:MAG: glycosyltransferase [Bacteroidetes bacterium]|nr:glycosyltransferase [Bacteroidota bacterium]MBU1718999.1 glycosyltransferase [Bacteroidota bacterium]